MPSFTPSAKTWTAPSDEEVRARSAVIRLQDQVQRQKTMNENRRRFDEQVEHAHRELELERRRSMSHAGRYPFTQMAKARANAQMNAAGMRLEAERRHHMDVERRIAEQQNRIAYGAQQQRSHVARQARYEEGNWLREQQLRQQQAEARAALEHEHQLAARRAAEQQAALHRREQAMKQAEHHLREQQMELAAKQRAEAQRHAEDEMKAQREAQAARESIVRRQRELEQREMQLQTARLEQKERALREQEQRFEEEKHAYQYQSHLSANTPTRPLHRRFASDTHLPVDLEPPQLPSLHSPTMSDRAPPRPTSMFGNGLSSRRSPRREDTIRPGDALTPPMPDRGVHFDAAGFPHSAPPVIYDDFDADQNGGMFAEPEMTGALFPTQSDLGPARGEPLYARRGHSRNPSASSQHSFAQPRSRRNSESHPDIGVPFAMPSPSHSRHASNASGYDVSPGLRSRRQSEAFAM